MDVVYHKWLELEMTHNYFPNGICSVFRMMPFESTVKSCKNYEIRFSKKNNKMSLFAGSNAQETFDVVTTFSGLESLYFQVLIDDPLFYNYSQIPSIGEEQIFYFENGKNSTNPSVLHKDSFVGQGDLMNKKPLKFNISIPSGTETKIQVKLASGEVIVESTIEEGMQTYPVNLSQFNEGVFEIWLDGEMQERFFACGGDLPMNCIGVFHLDVEKLKPIYEDGLKYSINVEVRSVFWEYKVIVSESRKIDVHAMEVIGSDTKKYSGPVENEVIGGQKAQMFTSNEARQLQQKLVEAPQLHMTYSNDSSTSQNQLEIKMPNPSPDALKKFTQGENAGAFYVSTIIYV